MITPSLKPAAVAFSLLLFGGKASCAEESFPSEAEVRKLLFPSDRIRIIKEDGTPLEDDPLMKYRDRLFPVYEIIINDPKTDRGVVCNALYAVAATKGDRTRFLLPATELLTSPSDGIRRAALELLGDIGTERDSSPIVALLSDEDYAIRRLAAKTLAKIGSKRDLVAMDIWLKTGNYRGDVRHLEHVKKCRDLLDKRIKEAAKIKDARSNPFSH